MRAAAAQMAALRSNPTASPSGEATVRALPFVGSDEDLVRGLRQRQPAAIAALCDRYSRLALRLLMRILGGDNELADLHHDVFVRAVRSAHTVRDAAGLQGWIGTIAVNVARARLKDRARRRWLLFLPAEEMPEPEVPEASEDAVEALRRTYALLERLPREERIAFALRTIDGMKLQDVAAACGVSLATIKRKLAAAEKRFYDLARQDDVLREWLPGGGA